MVEDRNRAEALFADWLSRRDAGRGVPIAWFAAAHPAHANDLLHLHRVWKRLDEFAGPSRGAEADDAVAARLKARLSSPPARAIGQRDAAATTSSVIAADSRFTLLDRRAEEDTIADEPPSESAFENAAESAATEPDTVDEPGTVDEDFAPPEPVVSTPWTLPAPVPVSVAPVEFATPPRLAPPSRDLKEIFELSRSGAEGWNLTRAVSTILRVCEAMEGSHEKGVIHRDLGPRNVKIGRHGEVFVMDWGSARVIGAPETRDIRPDPSRSVEVDPAGAAASFAIPLLSAEGDPIVSPACLSPERAAGDIEAMGPWSDVYSIGAMLYELLAGHPPYLEPDEIENGKAILKRILAGPPEPIQRRARHAPAELAAICERAMARSPSSRYSRVADLAEDLRAFLERRVVKAYRIGLIPETRTWLRRHRDIAATIGVGIVLLAGFALERHREAARADRERDTVVVALEAAREAAEVERARSGEREQVFRLADHDAVVDLVNRGHALLEDRSEVYRSYLGYHALLGSLENWIDDAESLLGRLGEHEVTLARLEARGTRDPASGAWIFESAEDAWWRDRLAELVASFRRLGADDRDAITISAMRARAAEYSAIYRSSIAAAREAWDRCIASIADIDECPEYAGLRIVPQLGLIPIGRDPESRLWEFAVLSQDTHPPTRDETSRLVPSDDSAIVLVLLPGGTFWMGAQSEDPSGPNYDPWAFSDLAPVRRVSLAPYFLGKYELTERQWASLRGDAPPVTRGAGRDAVSSIAWTDAVAVLGKKLLDLPTEAQWEFACRAGTSTPWSTGSEGSTLAGYANVRIPELQALIGDDESPVGSFRPNAYGLHDLHGNLFEWCRDGFESFGDDDPEFDPRTGERHVESPALRAFRGGCFREEANVARSAFRLGKDPKSRVVTIGIRPSRDLMPN